MRSLLNRDSSWAYPSILLITGCAVAIGLWARLYDLGFPPEIVWDESYYTRMANKYLHGNYRPNLHPPLGKFIIAAGMAIFGNEPLGWRLMPAVFGCAMLPLGFFLGWTLFRQRVGALLLAAFLAGETILIVHSRTGVMDIFLVFFILATFLAALRAQGNRQVIWSAVLLGLAIGVKWAALPVVIPVGYVLWRKGLLRPFLAGLWVSGVVYIAVVYIGALIGVTANPIRAWFWTWEWHLRAARRITLRLPHLWASPWWSWPIMLRPIRYYYGANPDGTLRIVLAIGNPLLWWGSTLAVVAGIVEVARKAVARTLSADDPIVPIVLGYVFLMLPWVPGTRYPYIYNYLVPYSFAILALIYWLCRIWDRPRWGPWVVVGFAACALAMTLFFLPLATTFPISQEGLMRRVWIDYWFYPKTPVPGSGKYDPGP